MDIDFGNFKTEISKGELEDYFIKFEIIILHKVKTEQ